MLEQLLTKRSGLGDKKAVSYGKHSYTYGELESTSGMLASVLHKHGIESGMHVLASISDPVNFLILLFSCLKTGSVLVPMSPDLEKGLYEAITERVNPALVIDDYRERGVSSESLFDEMNSSERFESFIRYDIERPCLILLTGGSTGKPKGAIISERSIIWNAFNSILSWGIKESDVSLVSLPLYHTGGWNVLLIPTLMAGGTAVFSGPRFNESEILDILQKDNVTYFMGVPSMLERISGSDSFQNSILDGKIIISGGGMLRAETAKRFWNKGARVFQGYGLTEAGPNNFYIPPEVFREKTGSVGKPCLFVEVKLSHEGELLIRGPHTFSGYLWDSDEQPFDSEGFLRTGDIFRTDQDGDYYFVGRKKAMIKTGGENVFATEVERAILELDYVKDCIVMGVSDDYWGEMVVAFVVTGHNVEEATIKNDLKPLLAHFKIPKRFIFVSELPRTPVGKPDRARLVKLYEQSIS